MILSIAEKVPHGSYNKLGVTLGFDLNEVGNIRTQYLNDTQQALEELLSRWKNQHGGGPEQKEQLRSILVSTRLGDIAARVLGPKPDGEAARQSFAQQGNFTRKK